MKTIKPILIIAASIIAASCSKDISIPEVTAFEIEASVPATSNKIWKSGEVVGAFSSQNTNIRFVASTEGRNAKFLGDNLNNSDGEYVYLTYPYIKGASLDSEGFYHFTIPAEQIQQQYTSSADLTPYSYMVGHSRINDVYSDPSFEFYPIMSRMDFVVANNSIGDLKINRIVMSSVNNENLFSTSAKIKMSPEEVNLDNYFVSEPSSPSLSVRITEPDGISTDKSRVISIAFFPVSIEGGTELEFTIETNKGNYKVRKTIGGLNSLSFKKGEYYITPLTIS